MILVFPNTETLRLALTTGAIPPAISRTTAVCGCDAEGRLYVEPSESLPRASLAELRRLGVDTRRTSAVALTEQAYCWPQLLPLSRGEPASAKPEQMPVLFDLPADQFGLVASEMLRLANDRQSFRVVTADGTDEQRVLLRVVGPPYYSLLRAIEQNGDEEQPAAYVECAPRVWVQFGYRHPLGEHFKPSPGKLLFMQPPRRWTFFDEAPFRDIYEVLDFTLPDAPAAWRESELASRVCVSLRLAHAGGAEPAELWVVRDDPLGQLDGLVQSADDQLLARLAFAVGRKDDQITIILRARPSKLPPPVLVLNAVAFRPYLKLPNLFLPCGQRLHPPLRRDAVRQRLADDAAVVTWLHPAGDGGFTPESLPDQAFRPLAEWVDYVLDHEAVPLQEWVQSTQFDFEGFVCDEETPSKPRKSTAAERRRAAPVQATPTKDTTSPRGQQPPLKENVPAADEPALLALPAVQPSQARKQLDAVEAQFLALTGPLDAPERQPLWAQMARLNTALGNEDAVTCWLHALWSGNGNVAQGASWWLNSETVFARRRADAGAALARAPVLLAAESTGGDLDRLLAVADPTTAEVRGLAAHLLCAASQRQPPGAVTPRLNPMRQFLERHDRLLPLRAAWLAWTSMAALADGDVLLLARARDRLLERLFQTGLRPDQELPSFLRFGGQTMTHRFRAIRPWLAELREVVGRCCLRMDAGRLDQKDRSQTPACLDLIFAFGMARLGESEASARFEQRAATQLATGDEFHAFLRKAYGYRIAQARDGKPSAGPLLDTLLEYLATKKAGEREAYDRLREYSRIVEPHEGVHWSQDYEATDNLAKQLAQLPRIRERKPLAAQCRALLTEHADEPAARVRVLQAVLREGPRLGEEFSAGVLHQVGPAYDALPSAQSEKALAPRADLLEKAIFVAAHFGHSDLVQALLHRFQQLLHQQMNADAPHVFTSLAGECLRGLRKLGLRQEIEMLLRQLEELLLQGKKPDALTAADFSGPSDKLLALLHLAAGWYYFGRDTDAEPVVAVARAVLLSGPLRPGWHPKGRAELACAYAATLGHAPLEFAQERFVELFQKLESVATSWHTTPGYCALQVKLVESVVLAVVSDDFTQGAEMRRWLDDEEFVIRQRIHADLRTMMANT